MQPRLSWDEAALNVEPAPKLTIITINQLHHHLNLERMSAHFCSWFKASGRLSVIEKSQDVSIKNVGF